MINPTSARQRRFGLPGYSALVRRWPQWRALRASLFHKYVALFLAVVSLALLTSGLSQIWFAHREHQASLIRIQREQAGSAAEKISQFVKLIETQIEWTLLSPWSEGTLEQRRFDARRLLRQVPAISELSQLDAAGRERLRVSRLAMDVIGSDDDFSTEPKFREAMARKVYYGPVYFRRESEPYMTVSLAGSRRDSGVSVAEVNLRFIWDVISQIKVGERGRAYVVDSRGRLVAHPDISLVLRNTDLSHLPQVLAARHNVSGWLADAIDARAEGGRVLAAYAPVIPPGWLVLAELPIDEAYAPLVASLRRSALLLVAALALALLAGIFLARRMLVPIRALETGAARIGNGDLSQRISIKTGDELEALGDQFNRMAAQLQEYYATLERKVGERTHELELANSAKSRFLAAASHDLRQPLHALGLFVAQLQGKVSAVDRDLLVERINAAIAAMHERFDALLDISKLDAGALTPNLTEFAVGELLARVEATFAGAAHEKSLSFHIRPSTAWVRSDFILLERIVQNLVSNAIHHSASGGILVGCRRRKTKLRVEVWDTGPGIAELERARIFEEFYQVSSTDHSRHGGMGLGLAIVERLCRLLGYRIELDSVVGRGSRFAVMVPLVAEKTLSAHSALAPKAIMLPSNPQCIVVIDDDAPARDALASLLRQWGLTVVAAGSDAEAMAVLAQSGNPTPDLVIADYHLAESRTGLAAIDALRDKFRAPIPAFLISGDTAQDREPGLRALGYHLMRKPVSPMALRATLARFLKRGQTAPAA